MSERFEIGGIGAAPGRALGPARVWRPDLPTVVHRTITPEEVDGELDRFEAARAEARDRLASLAESTGRRLGEFEGRMFEAQAWMIDDPLIVEGTRAYIRENFLAAERAFDLQMLEHRVRMLDSGHAMVLDRLSDLADVRTRVLSSLMSFHQPELPGDAAEPVILVARDLPPSLAARLDAETVAGFVMAGGSRGAHSVVIARSLGIPAIVGVGGDIDRLDDDVPLLVDGRAGRVIAWPAESEREAFRDVRMRSTERQERLESTDQGPVVTRDGVELTFLANIDRPDEVPAARRLHASGVGLFRSEFLVIGHPEIPSEEEQLAAYRAAVEAMPGHPVVLRTFDIGGDKFPMFLSMPREENPYLGWRAIRVCLDLPDLFRNQLRAAARARRHGDLRLLIPFVTSVREVERTRDLLDAVVDELGADAPAAPIPLGVMIETPAALEEIDSLAPHVDFLSLGTNDLTQYVLAADRGNARLAQLYDPLHPALVRMYRRLVDASRSHGLPLSICGELAGDPVGLACLVGLGYRSFSISLAALPEQRDLARAFDTVRLADIVADLDGADSDASRGALGSYLAEVGAPPAVARRLSADRPAGSLADFPSER